MEGINRNPLNLELFLSRDIIRIIVSVLFCSKFLLFVVIIWSAVACNPDNSNQSNAQQTTSFSANIDSSQWLRPTRGIRHILEDRDGNIWFTTPDYISKFDGNTNQYFVLEDQETMTGFIHQDANGEIWFENGFNMYQFIDSQFEKQALDVNTDFRETESYWNKIWFQKGINPSDTLPFEPGIIGFYPEGSQFYPYPIPKSYNNKHLYYPTTPGVWDTDSILWFGTMEKVFGFQKDTFIVIDRVAMGRTNDPRQIGIRGIFVDSKGQLWMADNGAGVFVYDGARVFNFTKQNALDEGEREGNTLHRAFSIAEDSMGFMWFGTVYSGVWRYNPKTAEFDNYTQKDGLDSEVIWTIYPSRNGSLLFAGEMPGAVYSFNGKSFERVF